MRGSYRRGEILKPAFKKEHKEVDKTLRTHPETEFASYILIIPSIWYMVYIISVPHTYTKLNDIKIIYIHIFACVLFL